MIKAQIFNGPISFGLVGDCVRKSITTWTEYKQKSLGDCVG